MATEQSFEQSRLEFLRDSIRMLEKLQREINADLLHDAEVQLTFEPKQRGSLRDGNVRALAAVYTLDDYLAAELAYEQKRLQKEL